MTLSKFRRERHAAAKKIIALEYTACILEADGKTDAAENCRKLAAQTRLEFAKKQEAQSA